MRKEFGAVTRKICSKEINKSSNVNQKICECAYGCLKLESRREREEEMLLDWH